MAILEKKILRFQENQPKLIGYQGWVEILMITLVYSKRVSVHNNLLNGVNRVKIEFALLKVPKHSCKLKRRAEFFYSNVYECQLKNIEMRLKKGFEPKLCPQIKFSRKRSGSILVAIKVGATGKG